MTAREQLHKKLSDEYDAFIADLKALPFSKIIDSAYEKAFKENIVYSFEQDGAYSDKEIDFLLTVENPLKELYLNWVNTDVSHMDDLSDSISGYVVSELKQRQNGVEREIKPEQKEPEIAGNSGKLMPTSLALNGELCAGDYVIAESNNNYGYLVGQVTNIDKIGMPEHDTDNPNDNVHVNFKLFDYPPSQQSIIENRFSELSGGNFTPFDDLPLDDVILAPDMLINLRTVSTKAIIGLIADFKEAEKYCDSVIDGLMIDREGTLLQRIDKNLKEYHDYLTDFGTYELIDMAGKINAMSEMYEFMSSRAYAFSDEELDYLLQFRSPLEVVADAWAVRYEDRDTLNDFLYDFCNQEKALYNYAMIDAVEASKETSESAEKPEILSTKEQLLAKMRTEYDEFIGELKQLPPGKIIECSYEKVFKEDLLAVVENETFTDEQVMALLSLDKPLDALYQDWLSSDVSPMDMLHDSVEDSANWFIEERKAEQELSEKTFTDPSQKPKAVSQSSSLLNEVREAKREIEAKQAEQPVKQTKKYDKGID